MTIATRRGIWIFATIVTLISMTGACALNFVLFPPEIVPTTLRGTVLIVLIMTVPTCLWVGDKIRSNHLLSMQLKDLVERDRLTDVSTRDFFFERLARKPDAYGVSLMIDIDHFKRVNDDHGHLIGDEVIKTVARVLKQHVRDGDIVCRFGGEEFVVFLQEADAARGLHVAERMRKSVEDAVTLTEGAVVNVTVSIGGSLKDGLEDITLAIKDADDALYYAKQTGRNRTVMSWRDGRPDEEQAVRA